MSSTFHCDSPEIGFRYEAFAPGTRRRSHATICQSPRVQRWRRLTSAAWVEG
ncbi:MAG: hypothetical protein IPL61_10125 [Myxococcales bacterium]|nr:hypothetical protein [Myxococcales bacterium]